MVNVTPEEKLLNVIKKAQGRMRLKKELKIFTKVNFILASLIIVILAIFLVDLFTPDYKAPELNMDLPEEKVLPIPEADEGMYEEKEVLVEQKSPLSKQDLIKNLNLLGIVESENSQAIIEDKETKRTFFLYKGDRFGEFTVYDIKESGIIFDYKGEKIELRM
jgi:hypothetical protein